MEKKTYLEKLKDPRWQKKRLEILERDGWKCKLCGRKDITLHVHHIFYIPNCEPWDIDSGFLIAVCENCHTPSDDCESTHYVIESLNMSLGFFLNQLFKTDYEPIGILMNLGLYFSKKRGENGET